MKRFLKKISRVFRKLLVVKKASIKSEQLFNSPFCGEYTISRECVCVCGDCLWCLLVLSRNAEIFEVIDSSMEQPLTEFPKELPSRISISAARKVFQSSHNGPEYHVRKQSQGFG